MLARPQFPPHKTILLINDVPVKSESAGFTDRETGKVECDKFSAPSNLNLLTSFRTGRVYSHAKVAVEGFKGVFTTDIATTYLDYTYYGDPEVANNFDFKNELCSRKDLTTDLEKEDGTGNITKYFKLENQKDIYASERLWGQFTALLQEIDAIQPKIIVVTGKWALFFLTGCTSLAQTQGSAKDRKPLGGITKFRSSIMQLSPEYGHKETILIPIYHTIHAVSMPNLVPAMELDLHKIAYMYYKIKETGTEYYIKPDKTYILGTDKTTVLSYLAELKQRLDKGKVYLSLDVETFFKSYIDCIGITDSIDSGLCIPFATKSNPNFWDVEDEIEIMVALKATMEHPNALHVGQNYAFDCQVYHKLWCIDAKASVDTMVLHHIMYNYLPKDLAFMASLYCEHYTQWKGEIEATKEDPSTRWKYNIKDVCYTLEIANVLLAFLEEEPKLKTLYLYQQSKVAPALVKIMNKGVKIDTDLKERYKEFFSGVMDDITLKINDVLGFEFNQNSTPQKKKLFSTFFGMELKKKGANETCDAAAMLQYIDEYPLYKPFLSLLLEAASLKVFVTNFLSMQLDDDERARTFYNIAGTLTGRLASRKNIWGKGANFQNLPEKGKINLKYALEVVEETMEEDIDYMDLVVEGSIRLPNVKKIILPDEGMELAEADYSGADAMIVAWDSECKWLIDFFERQGEKLYAYIASEHLQREITSASPEYKKYKAVCHGSNYGLGLPKLCSMLRISYEEGDALLSFYFGLCPEIKLWQSRIRSEIASKGYIENIFGRRAWFLDKKDPTLFNKAFAFKPQSTIADLTNHAMVDIIENHKEIDVLLQVHDALVSQYPIVGAEQSRKNIISCMERIIPYSHPLKIPVDIKVSTLSYGDTKKPKKVDARDYKIIESSLLEKNNA